MKLKLIAYPEFFEGEEQIVSLLLQKYNFTFHLRKPNASVDEYRKFLQNIPEVLHARIMLHDAFELYKEFVVQGLHFSTQNRNKIDGFQSGTKSTSCHSIVEAGEWDGKVESMFLSPVYPSISKQGYTSVLSKTEVKNYLHQPRISNVFALGGIDTKNIPEIAKMGFDGITVLGAIWGIEPGDYNKVESRLKTLVECLSHVHIA